MIKKIRSIENFGVFKNFNWDNNVIDDRGRTLKFKEINIIYGRNYSGKTTLSRILQSFENRELPPKFENPKFEIELEDGTILTQDNVAEYHLSVRVFNEDFIFKHFRFFIDPDGAIEPFAVLGENVQLEEEIRKLEEELGKEEPEPTGLYKELKDKEAILKEKETVYKKAEKNLEESLRRKATDKKIGIKYNPKFGDPSYDIRKLKRDIDKIINENVSIVSDEEKEKLEKLIKEESKEEIPPLQPMNIEFDVLKNKVKALVEKKVVKTEKIEELVKNALLNRWVQDGKKLHEKYQLKVCAFCGNPISEERWQILEKHFDEESEKLENEIKDLIKKIDDKIHQIDKGFKVNKNLFYSKFHNDIDDLIREYEEKSTLVREELEKLKKQLEVRKQDIINEKKFEDVVNHTRELEEIFDKYENLRQQSNEYTDKLQQEQRKAKEKLRMREVYDFITTIDYGKKVKEMENLKNDYEVALSKYKEVMKRINEIKEQIERQKRLMKNEEEGAKKVNQYLNNYFGHPYLSLIATEEYDEITKDKQIKFSIFRGESIAHNLSEGEKTLIAFCYFIAKLEDIYTDPKNTIIWIDDPVSSLDSNHIFFIYSLINEIIMGNKFKQLFITTHNLGFLKYLKRINGDKIYLIVNRINGNSIMQLMPRYLKEYVTEFNYLFEQIYICATEEINDGNYHAFYNFGNNARKFLEIYLFYKYPDTSKDIIKYKKFFEDNIPAIITDRINNEYSHLKGILERGEQPIEAIESIKKVAKLILKQMKKLDSEQYHALLRSIGVDPNE